ncbi:MAG: hypothetical protein ACWA41_05790 [Putridiphycobacter sp.]
MMNCRITNAKILNTLNRLTLTERERDLSNPNVDQLNQIKWIFDGRKTPSDFITNIENAIDNLPLTEELALKFTGQDNISVFRNYLKSEISNIFKLQ